VYSFVTYTRTGESRHILPNRFVIFEGLFALYDPLVRELCRTKVFAEIEDAVCLDRRVARDVRERGRTLESVIRQYNETVRPMYEKYVLPTRAFADLVVRGDEAVEKLAAAVMERL